MDVAKTIFPCSERDLNESAYERCEAGESGGEDGRKGGHDLGPDFSLKSNPISCQAVVTPRPRETDINEEGREVKKQGANENKGPNPRL